MAKYLMAALILLAYSCNENTSTQLPPTPSTDGNVQVVKKMFEAFNNHDWKTMVSYYSADAQYLDPSSGKAFISISKDSVIAKYTELQQIFPDIKDSLINIFGQGDKVAVEFISKGSSKEGQHLVLPICAILTLKDSLIVKDATYYDNSAQ